jgi:GDP-4-dehydro-6-deoxy-D-mannose reductase
MAPERVLVTGAGGFVGAYVVRELAEHGSDVISARRADADVTDAAAVRDLLERVRPACVVHLAGLREAPLAELLRVNVIGTANVVSAAAAQGARVVVVGSAAEYGATARDPIDEDAPLEPRTDYGVSKAAQGLTAAATGARLGAPIVRLRLFNLVGPGEPRSFVASAFAERIAAIEAGHAEPPLRTGDLTTRRDFVDVRDAAGAIRLAATLDTDVYNVCSGRAVAIRELLDELLQLAGLEAEIESTPEPEGGNVRGGAGSAARFREATGWEPRIPLRQSLADVLADLDLCPGASASRASRRCRR